VSPRIPALVGVLLMAACNASPPGPDEGQATDAGGQDLLPPLVEVVPATPLETAAIRGTAAGASRVVVKSASADSFIAMAGPDGSFCIDATLGEGTTRFNVYAVSDDGRISTPVEVTTRRDPAIATPPEATCRNGGGQECLDTENCTNGEDDDCDFLADDRDTDCNGCVDDYLEPNDAPQGVPVALAGTYDLSMCPYSDDWFSLQGRKGSSIFVTINFKHAQADLDLRLYRAAEAASPSAMPVASSLYITDSENINWQADEDGTYYLKVSAQNAASQAPYKLTVR
jgi:hypothetical protein